MAPDICREYPPDRDGAPLLVDTQAQGVELVDADIEEAAPIEDPNNGLRCLMRVSVESLRREGLQNVERGNVPQALAGLKPVPCQKAEVTDGHSECPSSSLVVVKAASDEPV
eukprot:10621324-Lingulodinium_polyedra.AAC.1